MSKTKSEQLLDSAQLAAKKRKARSPKSSKVETPPSLLPALGFYVQFDGKSGQIVKKLSRRNLILWESGEVSAMDDAELKAAVLEPGTYQPKDVPVLVNGKTAIFKGEYSATNQIHIYPPDSHPIRVDRKEVQIQS